MKKRALDFIDLLPVEACEEIDRCGYDFLASHGYNVEGAAQSARKRKKLKAALRADSRTLTHSTIREENAIVIFFALRDTEGNVIAKSKGLRFKIAGGEKTG
jgi:hypothetical protein